MGRALALLPFGGPLRLASRHHEPGMGRSLGRGAAFPTQFPAGLAAFSALFLKIAPHVRRKGFALGHTLPQDTMLPPTSYLEGVYSGKTGYRGSR